MLYIDDSQQHIQAAKNKHCQLITCYINRKVYGSSCADKSCLICKTKTEIVSNISTRLKKAFNQINIEQLVSSYPLDLEDIAHVFFTTYYNGLKKAEVSLNDWNTIEKIFNYKKWFSKKEANKIYNAYDLCEGLGIDTCIYCNRLYTSTVIDGKNGNKIIRPTLDHWFSQEEYPILALSFYNLIPSCSPCNTSVKHTAKFRLEEHVHPYVDKGVEKLYTLKSNYDSTLNKFKIVIDTKEKNALKTLSDMQIDKIYSHHQSELKDLDFLKRKYNKAYLQSLKNTLGKKLSEKDVYRLLLGVEYDDENFHKRPMSKLKKDILNLDLGT